MTEAPKVNIKALDIKLEELRQGILKAGADGDDIRVVELSKARAALRQEREHALVDAESGKRDAAKSATEAALLKVDYRALITKQNLMVKGTISKTETGWDRCVVSMAIKPLLDAIWPAIEAGKATEIASAKGIEFLIEDGKCLVTIATSSPAKAAKKGLTSTGQPRGKGYSKGGEVVSLADAFNACATDAQKAELAKADAEKNGNKSFSIKKNAVLAAGYVPA